MPSPSQITEKYSCWCILFSHVPFLRFPGMASFRRRSLFSSCAAFLSSLRSALRSAFSVSEGGSGGLVGFALAPHPMTNLAWEAQVGTKIGNVYLKQPLLDENDESLLLGWGEMSLRKRKSCSQFPASGTGTAGRVPNSEQLRCISCAKMAAATHWPMEI